MGDFSIILPSSSSLNVFPKNKTGEFSVYLPKKITLNGEWEVALTEIQYPNTQFNVTVNNNCITFVNEEPSDIRKWYFCIPQKRYYNIETLIEAVNKACKSKAHNNLLEYIPEKNKVRVLHHLINSIHTGIYLENKLALQLGFLPTDNLMQINESPEMVSLERGFDDCIFVYCNIIGVQIIGHSLTQVLKVFTRENKESIHLMLEKEFKNLEYVNVDKKEFDIIDISLRTMNGDPILFSFGSSTLKLHFKKKSAQNE